MSRNKYPEETVERILDTAQRLFLEKGYEQTTIQDITDNLGGLTKGAIYHHFKSKEEIIERWRSFEGEPQRLGLPSAPKPFLKYFEEDDRPQAKLDRDYENGMGVTLGRLREDTVFDYKFVGLSHNTVRGAAGGAILCAELLTAKGYITKK